MGLKQKGYDAFLPESTPVKTSLTSRPIPLFPGYVFCRWRENSSGLILSTPGVLEIVRLARVIATVPDSEIESIRRLVQRDIPRMPWQNLPEGARVRINSGPLSGLEGTLVEVTGRRKLIVSISLLQRSVAASLDDETDLVGLNSPMA